MGEIIRFAKLNREQAQKKFGPGAPSLGSVPKSRIEKQIREKGIAKICLGMSTDAFQDLSDQYAFCIEEHGDLLDWTSGSFDKDGIPEDGHVRKDLDFNPAGMQIADPKNLFHFNNSLWTKWSLQPPKYTSPEFDDFMEHGFQLHSDLTKEAQKIAHVMDRSYVGIKELLFPRNFGSTTLRLLRYDPYLIYDNDGKLIVENGAQVAKPHYDRGGMTIQAYASAPGFWRQPESARGPKHEKILVPHGEGESQVFFGLGFRHVYGTKTPIHDLYHGVNRYFDEKQDFVPARTAAILFVDPPLVNLDVKSIDTQPDRVDKDKLYI
jgi:hypothetical protein